MILQQISSFSSAKYYLRNDLTPTDGVMILIHNRTEMPELISRVIRVQPQTMTNLGLKLQNIDRLKLPYISDCTDRFPENLAASGSVLPYTEAYCNAECRTRYINRTCGCWHPYLIPAKVRYSF